MEIRYKFRSSPNFDTINIGQQSSISIFDLKTIIMFKNNLKFSRDSNFDLVFSDFISGTEYRDENTRIRGGSSVIIKRVPAESSSLIRHSEKLLEIGEKLKGNHPTQFSPKESSENEASTLVMQSKPVIKDQPKFIRDVDEKNMAMENCSLPSELNCSVCKTYFKEAVMIPCCQHSFCDKCIRIALVETSRCPKCYSTKCKPEDLLPNLSLRQTVIRFLESDLHNGLENNLDECAPDAESGIHVRELSYAPKDIQSKRSATKISTKVPGNTNCKPVALENCIEFEGENELMNMAVSNEEGNSCIKKRDGFHGANDGKRNFLAPCRLNKGLRTCYTCGSSDHLVRDCPAAAASTHAGSWNGNIPFHGVQGYAPQYWPGNFPFHGVPSYAPQYSPPPYNMPYGPEMMAYYANMAAATPFTLSPYASPMFNGYPGTSGSLTFGGMPPFYGNNAQQMGQSNLVRPMGCAKQQGSPTEAFGRDELLVRDDYIDRQHGNTDRSPYHSGDSFARRTEENHNSHERLIDDDKYSNGRGQDKISRSSEGKFVNARLHGSTTEKATPDSRIRPYVGRHENTNRCSRRNDEMIAEHDNDSKRRRMKHERRSDREIHSHSGSVLEPSYSSGDGRRKRDDYKPRSRHLNENSKPYGKDTYHERERMIRYSDDDCLEDYHSHKRKRCR